MIRFAGVDCLLEDPDGTLAEFLRSTELDHNDLFGASPVALKESRNHSVSHTKPLTPLPTPNYPNPPAIRLNQLYWPTGAVRWSHCILLVNKTKLDEIYTAIGTETIDNETARYADPQQLIFGSSDFDDTLPTDGWLEDSNGNRVIATAMSALPARPVSLPSDSSFDSLWMLPLVDERYFWQWLKLPHRANTVLQAGETEENILHTWDGWRRIIEDVVLAFDRVGGGSRTLDWVPAEPAAEFFAPDATSLWNPQHNIAVILDAMAHSCGCRFVRQFDGSLELIDSSSSLTRHGTNASAFLSTAGGMITVPPIGGGTITTQSSANSFPGCVVVPEHVDVVFRKIGETDPDFLPPDTDGPAPYDHLEVKSGIATRTIRANTAPNGAENIAHDTAKVIYTPTWIGDVFYDDGAAAGSEDTTFFGDRYFRMTDVLTQDVVRWMQQLHEYDLPQFCAWQLTGYDDFVLWRPDRGGTHVRSMPYNFGVDTMLIQAHTQTDFDPDYLEGYLLETLEAAEVLGGTLAPKLARMAVYTLFADYDFTSDSRHEEANWTFQWVRTGQMVVCSTSEDLEAEAGYPIGAKRFGQTFRPVWVGCQVTQLSIGEIQE